MTYLWLRDCMIWSQILYLQCSKFCQGGTDNTVKIWDFHRAMSDIDTYDINLNQGNVSLPENGDYLMSTFTTKSTPILHLHFTRRNLLLAVGSYTPTWIRLPLSISTNLLQSFYIKKWRVTLMSRYLVNACRREWQLDGSSWLRSGIGDLLGFFSATAKPRSP